MGLQNPESRECNPILHASSFCKCFHAQILDTCGQCDICIFEFSPKITATHNRVARPQVMTQGYIVRAVSAFILSRSRALLVIQTSSLTICCRWLVNESGSMPSAMMQAAEGGNKGTSSIPLHSFRLEAVIPFTRQARRGPFFHLVVFV